MIAYLVVVPNSKILQTVAPLAALLENGEQCTYIELGVACVCATEGFYSAEPLNSGLPIARAIFPKWTPPPAHELQRSFAYAFEQRLFKEVMHVYERVASGREASLTALVRKDLTAEDRANAAAAMAKCRRFMDSKRPVFMESNNLITALPR